MLEESIPSIWASLHSWFTPTVLFILINVVIVTIAISSSQREEKNPNPQLSRTSFILQRLRTFNLYRQKTEEIPPVTTTLEPEPEPEPIETVKAVETVDASDSQDHEHFTRSQYDTHPTADERPQKMAHQKMMVRSASARPSYEAEDMVGPAVRRPSTMRNGSLIEEDEQVDARADDFISKFKHQLKLQQMESNLKGKEIINAN